MAQIISISDTTLHTPPLWSVPTVRHKSKEKVFAVKPMAVDRRRGFEYPCCIDVND